MQCPRLVSVSELRSRLFKLVILEAAVFGVAVGGIGGPFHWDKPCAVVWDASGVGMAPLRAMQMLADGFAAPDPSWFRCQKRVSGKHPFKTLQD